MSLTIFEGKSTIIPLAEVAFIEKNNLPNGTLCGIHAVMKGAVFSVDAQGILISGYGRADCPYIIGEEMDAFIRAWRRYRRYVDIPAARQVGTT